MFTFFSGKSTTTIDGGGKQSSKIGSENDGTNIDSQMGEDDDDQDENEQEGDEDSPAQGEDLDVR